MIASGDSEVVVLGSALLFVGAVFEARRRSLFRLSGATQLVQLDPRQDESQLAAPESIVDDL
jgi:hypothetical protein